MGLGKGIAPAICEHAVLTRAVDLAWPDRRPCQIWRSTKNPSPRHDLLELKTREDCERIKSVIFDLTQLVFAFPKMGRQWIRENGTLPYAKFEDDDLKNAVARCIESGWTIGTVDQQEDGRYVVDVDTFTEEMLVGFLVDRLVDVKRGLVKMLPNLEAAYYVLDGERPAAKSVTAKKRNEARTRTKQAGIRQKVLEFLGPEREWMMDTVKVKKDGQEMLQGSLPDYILCRENLWTLIERLRNNIDQIGALKGNGVDVFLARGWHSRDHSGSCWFRVSGERPESTRPLKEYFKGKVDMEADAIMIRLARLAVDHLDGPCLMSTVDTDVVASMISMGSPDLYWAKQLKFSECTEFKLRTLSPDVGSKRPMVPEYIDLRTISPLQEPKIRTIFGTPHHPETFFFSGFRMPEPSTWSSAEAERRLVAVFILLMAGCDFCEKLENFGTRSVVKLLSSRPSLPNARFSRITHSKHMSKDVEAGMRHECLEQLNDAVRFPWRCGDFVCLAQITFESAVSLIRLAIPPRRTEGRDWKPFIRRVCYSIMTLSAPGIGLEKEVRENANLAQNYGYDSLQEYRYIPFENTLDGQKIKQK